MKTTRRILWMIGMSVCSLTAQAGEACTDNFSTTGNIFTGKTYKTFITVPNVSARDAFEGVMQFTLANGFVVLDADKTAGLINAAHSQAYNQGKTVPLNFVIKAAHNPNLKQGAGTDTNQVSSVSTLISMNYATPAAITFSETAVKKHFCDTALAAANSLRTPASVSTPVVSVAVPSTPAVVATSPAAIIPTPIPRLVQVVAPIAAAVTPPPAIAVKPLTVDPLPTPAAVPVAPVTARPISRLPVGYVVMAAEQKQAIEAILIKNIPNEKTQVMVKDAAPTIIKMVERIACLAADKGVSALNEFAAPNTDLAGYFATHYPMNVSNGMQSHDKNTCLTVVRVSAWEIPSLHTLRYEVTFKADDSGEIRVIKHEIIRQTDGSWLFGVPNNK